MLIQYFSFFLNLFFDQLIIFFDFLDEIFSVFEGLLDFFLKLHLVFNFFTVVRNEFLCEFLDLISLFFQLKNGLGFDLDHFFEVVALLDQFRNLFFVVSFVSFANLDQKVLPFMFKE